MPVNNLNLLPTELAVSKNLNKLLKTIRALGVIGIAAFLVFGIGVGVFFIFATLNLNRVKANVTKLSAQVSAQQKSEQQLILVKDRLKKITSIQALPNSSQNQSAITSILSNLSSGASVNELSIDSASVRLSANLKTNADITNFLDSFQKSSAFKTIILTSFSLSPINGYSVEVRTTK